MRLLTLCAVLAFLGAVTARTTFRQQSAIDPKITSLNDKDARRKAMTHPAFANAGKQAGLEIWRIEDFEPVPVPQKEYGKFYKGDSYIILKTNADKRNNLSWDIHYWLGAETSQDESGAAAILTVGLDDKFGGAAIQHREVQGYESQQFVKYFSPAIRYIDGGHASGFNHVTTNAGAEKRLFQIKGKRNVRVRQVDPLISSMNKGDCFILDVNHDIYVYVGEKAKNIERLKAISVANQIRDQDHNGRARVEIIDAYSSESDVQKFFTALGSGSRDTVPEENAGGDDQAFERNEETIVTLSEISDSSGKLKITPLSKPFKQEQLKPQECYILDTVTGGIYVWVGKQSTEREKNEAISKAEQYLASKNYPKWVHVSRIPQGTESAAFKQYFFTWKDVGMSHSRIVRSASDAEFYDSDEEASEKRAKLIGKTGSVRGFLPDQSDGEYTVYKIQNRNIVKLYDSKTAENDKDFGVFYESDVYIVTYKHNVGGETRHIIYYWVGDKSTTVDQATAAINAVLMDSELDGAALIFRVVQGDEPKHFLKIFKGRMVTYMGGHNNGYKKTNKDNTYESTNIRMFRISGTQDNVDTKAVQVKDEAESFTADDVYLLETKHVVYIWVGQNSLQAELDSARDFAKKICGEEKKVELLNGDEDTPDLRGHIGTQPKPLKVVPWKGRVGLRIDVHPKLFEVSLGSNNVPEFDLFESFGQEDLDKDGMYLLDLGNEIYIWIGKETDPGLKKAALSVGEAYIAKQGGNFSRVLIIIKQGMEPDTFTKIFSEWDDLMWMKQKTYEEEKENEIE